MKMSTNLKLKLIEGTDVVNVEDISSNFETLDKIATIATPGLMSATDKGKLDKVSAGANDYVHPSTHPASMISTTDSSNVQAKLNNIDTQMAEKVNKPTTAAAGRVATFNASKDVVDSGFTIGKSVPSNAVFTDTVYTHPTGTNPHSTTKGDVGLGNVDNVKQAPYVHTHSEYDKVSTGSYTGNDASSRSINIGFSPTAVFIAGAGAMCFLFKEYGRRISSQTIGDSSVELTSLGFKLGSAANYSNFKYDYIAFK